ncbi:hypothetical protein GCM10023153_00350 [Ornithinibacter aureus]|jgi:hypothetical protein|uniref:Uncharacterized protein n=1 Tax=Ornithinibacter aureus TaxID=622664 RepID=A0ABP8J7Y5_9MICO|nr:hypothetical protein [Ornithinibacter aureus]KAF0833854.1 hypothetical protein C8E84_1656 [Ornithinibacter aureus]
MTTYPHRYGDTDRAVEHYATACVASAKILSSAGLPDQAADLQAEAERARAQTHPDHPDYPELPGHAVDRPALDRDDLALSDPDLFDADGQVPRWWR